MDLSENRVYYQHELWCSGDNFTEDEDQVNGLKVCKDCAGVFDQNGVGVCVTSVKFDRIIT